MTTQYSHRQFFRRTPHKLLEKYFTAKSIELGVDFNAPKAEQAIFDALTSLPEEQQAMIETEFQDINAMASEGGVAALIDEAKRHQDESFVEVIAEVVGFHAKAMWAHLEKPEYWRAASLFLHADNVCASYWKKRNDLPHVPASTAMLDVDELAKRISHFFRSKEGRGRNCKVEVYRRDNKDYFFAYPEDFGQSDVEWEGKNLTTKARHPAFEIIFVYCQDEGSLDIYAPKNNKAITSLQNCFVTTILKHEPLEETSIEKQVYDLNPLANSNFEFQLEPACNIVSVVLTRMQLTLKYGTAKKRITLEADTKKDPKAIYALLNEIKAPPFHVTQVTLKATFDFPPGKRAKTRTFNITYPNSCALNHSGSDLLIRNMLIQSGIEPRAPKHDEH